jgi:hypothetical protein
MPDERGDRVSLSIFKGRNNVLKKIRPDRKSSVCTKTMTWKRLVWISELGCQVARHF